MGKRVTMASKVQVWDVNYCKTKVERPTTVRMWPRQKKEEDGGWRRRRRTVKGVGGGWHR